MKTGVGLALIAVGAILAFAVTTNTSVFNLHTAGWVLIIIGIIGIAIPRRGYGWVGRRVFTRQTRWRPGARVEEVTYPAYVNRNPANTRVQAGAARSGCTGQSGGGQPHRCRLRYPRSHPRGAPRPRDGGRRGRLRGITPPAPRAPTKTARSGG